MKTNIVISLDKRRVRKNGCYPIVLRISHFRRTITIPTDYQVPEDSWDKKRREVKHTYKQYANATRINNHLAKKRAEAMDIVTKLADQGMLKNLSVTQLKDRIIRPLEKRSFFDYAEEQVEKMNKAKRYGNARAYANFLKSMESHLKRRDLIFQEINYEFLKQYEIDFLARGNSYNGLSFVLRMIRAIYNRAINDGIIDAGSYPFKKYKIKREPTQKRAIPIESIRKITHLKLDEGHECFHARNFFIASFLMQGMSIIDMAFLKKENIAEGRIKYRRRKTARPYDMKITDQLRPILYYYLKGKRKSDWVFPILSSKNLEENYDELELERRYYNDNLKKIGRMCGIEQNLTSYVARHSFATQALLQGIPIKAISVMMGHSSVATTEVYLKSLPDKVIDEYHESISL